MLDVFLQYYRPQGPFYVINIIVVVWVHTSVVGTQKVHEPEIFFKNRRKSNDTDHVVWDVITCPYHNFDYHLFGGLFRLIELPQFFQYHVDINNIEYICDI